MSADRSASRLALAAVGLGLCSALFFTMTYVLNRVAASAGGDWAWTATLRYLVTLPLLLPLLPWQGGATPVWRAIRRHPWAWLRCSAIGFGAFYLLLSFAAASGPSWLVAGSFQFTVVAGILCAPLLYRDARRRIPRAALLVAVVILAGVLLLHLERSGERLNATQRVFGMTLASQPLWWAVAAWAWTRSGAPPADQVWLATGVALSAGVIATILFFQATGMVRDNPTALGGVEAMQGSELLFAILIGVLFLDEPLPGAAGMAGAALIVGGILAFAVLVARDAAASAVRQRALPTDKGA